LQSCSVLDSISPKWYVGKWQGVVLEGTYQKKGTNGLTDFKTNIDDVIMELTKEGDFIYSDNTTSYTTTFSISGTTIKRRSIECTINQGPNELYLDFDTDQYNKSFGTSHTFITARYRHKKL
jgi:hypothetical protein